MAIWERALGGSRERNVRAVLPERALKGENVVRTEVMYFVSILAYGLFDAMRVREDDGHWG